MSEKARHYLKHGRIFSAGNDGMCGIDFNLGELYLIAGSSPNVGICNYVKQYSKMTLVEKRGVAGGYKKGCECKVSENILSKKVQHSCSCQIIFFCFHLTKKIDQLRLQQLV